MRNILWMLLAVLFVGGGCREKQKSFTAKDFFSIGPGTPREEITERFGKPHAEAFGMFADFYITSDSVSIGIYYDNDSKVQFIVNPLLGQEGLPLLYYTTEQLREKLFTALDSGNEEELDNFFVEWNQLYYPNSEGFIGSNDTLRAVFSVFKAFYDPYNLTAYGNPEWGNTLNEGSRYAVIQNEIYYTVAPTGKLKIEDYTEYPLDTLRHFRPPLNIEAGKVLYMSKEYHAALSQILLLDPEDVDSVLSSADTYYRRLRHYIPIIPAHWSRNWHLTTHPHVTRVVFNNDLSSAKIDFRIGYQGGAAMMERGADQEWRMIESELTWIE